MQRGSMNADVCGSVAYFSAWGMFLSLLWPFQLKSNQVPHGLAL